VKNIIGPEDELLLFMWLEEAGRGFANVTSSGELKRRPKYVFTTMFVSLVLGSIEYIPPCILSFPRAVM